MKTIRMNKTGVRWLVFSMLLSLPAMGHTENGAAIGDTVFSIGPRATYVNPNDADHGKWWGGAQARIHLAKALAVEGSIDYYRIIFNSDTRIKFYPVQASLLAYLTPQSRISPFLLGGAGWYFGRIEGPNGFERTRDRFGLHAGGGLELKLNETISIDGTYRYVWLEDAVLTRADSPLDKKYDGSGSMVTAALNFCF